MVVVVVLLLLFALNTTKRFIHGGFTLLHCAGNFEQAIKDFTKVLEHDATNANAYFNRGSTHDSIGAYDKAIADYSKALELDKSGNGGNGNGRGGNGGNASKAQLAARRSAYMQSRHHESNRNGGR